jgi:hypothetical protein
VGLFRREPKVVVVSEMGTRTRSHSFVTWIRTWLFCEIYSLRNVGLVLVRVRYAELIVSLLEMNFLWLRYQ